ncbi:MAG: amidase family protein [Aquabacterium sp.]|nr:amidase family protein [Aquabacterium sp.]
MLLTTTLSHSAPPFGYFHPDVSHSELLDRVANWINITPINNVAGSPAMAVPFGSVDGMPGSLHLAAKQGGDRTIIEFAYEIEAAKPFASIMCAGATKAST